MKTLFDSDNESVMKNDTTSLIEPISALILIVVAVTSLYSTQMDPKPFLLLSSALFVSGFVLVITFVSPPTLKWIRRRNMLRKHNQIVRRNFKEFMDFVEDFSKHSSDNAQNIPYALDNIRSGAREFQFIYVPSVGSLTDLVRSFKRLLDRSDITGERFVLLIENFAKLIQMFYHFYLENTIKQIEQIGTDKIPDRHRQTYNQHRDRYCTFLENYKKFLRKVNRDLGEELLNVHYHQPPPSF